MLSPETKAAIDLLSSEEIEHELNLGLKSRFQVEKFAYVKTRKAVLAEHKVDDEKAVDSAQRRREFRLTSISTWVAIICSLVSLIVGGGWKAVPFIPSVFQFCSSSSLFLVVAHQATQRCPSSLEGRLD